MEKRGVIEDGQTPPEDCLQRNTSNTEKTAKVASLEEHATKRMADTVKQALLCRNKIHCGDRTSA